MAAVHVQQQVRAVPGRVVAAAGERQHQALVAVLHHPLQAGSRAGPGQGLHGPTQLAQAQHQRWQPGQ